MRRHLPTFRHLRARRLATRRGSVGLGPIADLLVEWLVVPIDERVASMHLASALAVLDLPAAPDVVAPPAAARAPRSTQARSHTVRGRSMRVLVATAVLVIAVTGMAFANVLPTRIQHAASMAAAKVGIGIPDHLEATADHGRHATTPSDARERSSATETHAVPVPARRHAGGALPHARGSEQSRSGSDGGTTHDGGSGSGSGADGGSSDSSEPSGHGDSGDGTQVTSPPVEPPDSSEDGATTAPDPDGGDAAPDSGGDSATDSRD